MQWLQTVLAPKLVHTVLYQRIVAHDAEGAPTFATAVQIPCFVSTFEQRIFTAQGIDIVPSYTVQVRAEDGPFQIGEQLQQAKDQFQRELFVSAVITRTQIMVDEILGLTGYLLFAESKH